MSGRRAVHVALSAALATGCGGARKAAADTVHAEPPSLACPTAAPETSAKRGAAFHFCGWDIAQGDADLTAMQGGLAWYYNWSSRPLTCPDGRGVGESAVLASGAVEFTPMAWGLVDGGRDCAAGGPCFLVDDRSGGAHCAAVCEPMDWSFDPTGACYACFHEPVSRQAFLDDVPPVARYLLGYNEPNFKEQANLTPAEAARGWRHVQWVADQRGLGLVGPATNFCDPTPGALHPGACIEAIDGDRMFGLAWLERFYDACTETGPAGFDCRIDHQAVHAYSCSGVAGMIERMKRKAGLEPPTDAHCNNGLHDEDEFDVDCGGNACVACSEHAKEMFSKPVWLTEFGTPSDDCDGGTRAELVARTADVLRRELPMFESDPYVYRYAWFMPKVGEGTLDHTDLLVEDEAGVVAPLGELYFGMGACPD